MSLKYEYEVSSLKVKIDKEKNTIELLPEHNLEDRRFRFCIKYAYMTFDTDMNIDKTISNITIANRASRGLISMVNGANHIYPIQEKWKEQWKNKIVVFFAYFDQQEKTPYFKEVSFKQSS